MKFKIWLMVAGILPGVLWAQTAPMQLTIREARDYALEHNKTLMNAKDDVSLAEAQLKEARGSGLPQVKSSLEYMTYFNYEFNFSLGGGSGEPPQIDYTKLDQGDFEIMKLMEQFTSSPSGSTIVMGDQASANVQVSQMIFNGQYWVGLELAKLGQQIREKSVSVTALDIKQQVINSCYLILITDKLLDVVKANQANLLEIAKHTKNLYDAGMAEITDVDQININLSQLANSRKAMERNLELNYNMLRMVMGLDSETPIVLNENLDSILASLKKPDQSVTRFDIFNNLNYQILSTQEQMNEKSVSMQKWAYAPSLVGFYNYKKKILTTAFDLSPNHAAGFTLSIPVFSGLTKNAQLTRAKIELDKTARNKELLEQQLSLQRNQLTFALKNAYENFQTQKENVEVAKRMLASIQNKYTQGMISSLELTQANSNYLQAENNYISSALELLRSNLEMDKLYNQL